MVKCGFLFEERTGFLNIVIIISFGFKLLISCQCASVSVLTRPVLETTRTINVNKRTGSRNSPYFMEHKGPLRCLQDPTMRPYANIFKIL
jgi:hypothetical protein